MIQQKPATDEALVRRARKAVQNGDETMRGVLEWDRRGRKPKREPEGDSHRNYDIPTEPVTQEQYRKAPTNSTQAVRRDRGMEGGS